MGGADQEGSMYLVGLPKTCLVQPRMEGERIPSNILPFPSSFSSLSVHFSPYPLPFFHLYSLSVYSLQYLPAIQAGSSPLLHTHTFLLARLSHLLFELGRAWSVSELTINTLHCMARQIKQLKVGWSHDCHVMSCDL